ncbi:hypothetical protein ACFE04_001333 [Oxalis oulophora]
MAEEEKGEKTTTTTTTKESKIDKKRKGFISRMFTGIFRHKDDFEKRLQHISKEESSLLSRMRNRSRNSRIVCRYLIMFSLLFEVVAVGYAIMTTRSMDMNWKMRAVRVLPMFLFPVLSSLTYSVYNNITRMCERKDEKTLERLRAERQSIIDELKERTNYYTTQQLIQRYDPDPAAKAAAATILASKLGADSGLKVYLGDESRPTGKSHDIEVVQAGGGLRNRKQLNTKSISAGNTPRNHFDDGTPHSTVSGSPSSSDHNQLVVNHYDPHSSTMPDGGWIARLAALLVGEDPTQSYALICGNCHMHNGLARKEDFPFITYYCPHCHALNCAKQQEESVFEPGSLDMSTLARGGDSLNKSSPLIRGGSLDMSTLARGGPLNKSSSLARGGSLNISLLAGGGSLNMTSLVEGDEQEVINNPANLAEDSVVTSTISPVKSDKEVEEENEQQPSNNDVVAS